MSLKTPKNALGAPDASPSTTSPSGNYGPMVAGLTLFVVGISAASLQIRYEYGLPGVVLFRLASCLVITAAGTMLFSCPREKSPAKAPLYFLLSVIMFAIAFAILYGQIMPNYFRPDRNPQSIGTEMGVVTIVNAILILVSTPFFMWRYHRTKIQGPRAWQSYDWLVYLAVAVIAGFGLDLTIALGKSNSQALSFLAMVAGHIVASTLLISAAFILGFSRFTSWGFFGCSMCCYLALAHPSLLVLALASKVGLLTLWGPTTVACDLFVTLPYAAWIGLQFAEPLSFDNTYATEPTTPTRDDANYARPGTDQ